MLRGSTVSDRNPRPPDPAERGRRIVRERREREAAELARVHAKPFVDAGAPTVSARGQRRRPWDA